MYNLLSFSHFLMDWKIDVLISISGSDETPPTCQSDESVAAALKDIKMAIQATRVLQHQTRIPSSSSSSNVTIANSSNVSLTTTNLTSTATINTVAMEAAVPTENGIISEDPWIKRGGQNQYINSETVTSVPPPTSERGSRVGQNQIQPPSAMEILPTSTAAAAVLNLPSAPANIIPNFSKAEDVLEVENDQVIEPVEDEENEDSEDDEEDEDDDDDDEEEVRSVYISFFFLR